MMGPEDLSAKNIASNEAARRKAAAQRGLPEYATWAEINTHGQPGGPSGTLAKPSLVVTEDDVEAVIREIEEKRDEMGPEATELDAVLKLLMGRGHLKINPDDGTITWLVKDID